MGHLKVAIPRPTNRGNRQRRDQRADLFAAQNQQRQENPAPMSLVDTAPKGLLNPTVGSVFEMMEKRNAQEQAEGSPNTLGGLMAKMEKAEAMAAPQTPKTLGALMDQMEKARNNPAPGSHNEAMQNAYQTIQSRDLGASMPGVAQEAQELANKGEGEKKPMNLGQLFEMLEAKEKAENPVAPITQTPDSAVQSPEETAAQEETQEAAADMEAPGKTSLLTSLKNFIKPAVEEKQAEADTQKEAVDLASQNAEKEQEKRAKEQSKALNTDSPDLSPAEESKPEGLKEAEVSEAKVDPNAFTAPDTLFTPPPTPEAATNAVMDATSAPATDSADAMAEGVAEGKEEAEEDSGPKLLRDTDPQVFVDNSVNKIEALPQVADEVQEASDKALEKSTKKVSELAKNEKKKKSADTKLAQSNKAVEPPKNEEQGLSDARKVAAVEKVEKPEVDAKKPKADFTAKLRKDLPRSEDAANDFMKEEKGKTMAKDITRIISKQTGTVKGTYEQVKNDEKAPPKQAEGKMPRVEKPIETPMVDLSEGLVPDVSPEQTDFKSFAEDSDKLLENENISEEHLNMVDSGDLFEARKEREGIKEQVDKAPEDAKVEAKSETEKLQKEVGDEDKKARKEMRAERKKNLEGAHKDQKKNKTEAEKKREKVTKDIDDIYKKANKQVELKLMWLEFTALVKFDRGEKKASADFDRGVARDLKAFFKKRYSEDGWFTGGWRWLGDAVFGTDDLPEVVEIFDKHREIFVNRMDTLVDQIITDNEEGIAECRKIIADARVKIQEYIDGLGPDLKKFGQDAYKDISKKLDELDNKVNEKEKEIKKKLEEKKKAAIEKIDKKIEEMKAAMSGALAILGNLLLDAALKFFKWALEKAGKSPDEIMGVLDKGKAVVTALVTEPGTFFSNLGSAVMLGFEQFGTNFMQHLQNSLVSWLLGAVGGLFQIPEKFDLMGVVGMVTSALGVGWDFVRELFVKRLGEPVVEAAEKGMDMMVTLVNEGPMGLWEDIKAELGDLKDMVIDAIKNWAITKIIEQTVIQLALMLNPAGAILKIIKTLYDAVMWFINNWQRILDFINGVFESIGNIAVGKIGDAANYIEKNLGLGLTMLLTFLARFVGLSGVGKMIQKTIGKFGKRIRDAIRKAVDKLTAKVKGWFKGGKGGKKDKKKDKDKKKEEGTISKLKDHEVGETVKFKAEGESHKLWVKEKGQGAELMMASETMTVAKRVKLWKAQAEKMTDKSQQATAKKDLAKLEKDHSALNKKATKTKKAIDTAEKTDKPADTEKATKLDNTVEKEQKSLTKLITKLFKTFGGEGDYAVLFEKQINEMDPGASHELVTMLMKNNDAIHKKMKGDKSWIRFKEIIEKEKEIAAMMNSPMGSKSAKHLFGKDVMKKQAIPEAQAAIQEKQKKKPDFKIEDVTKWVENRRGYVHGQKTEEEGSNWAKQIKKRLQAQIYDKKQKKEASKLLNNYFTDSLSGKSDHNFFKPVDLEKEELPNKAGWKVTYVYGKGERHFEVILNPDGYPIQVTGGNLDLHDYGRGVTHDPETGKPTDGHFDSAHLIANMFGGSGYKKGHNLIASSAEYNRESMLKQERLIAKFVKDNEAYQFGLVVNVEYMKTNPKTDWQYIKPVLLEEAYDSKKDAFAENEKDFEDATIGRLKNFTQPRIKRVDYLVSLFRKNQSDPFLEDRFAVEDPDWLFGT